MNDEKIPMNDDRIPDDTVSDTDSNTDQTNDDLTSDTCELHDDTAVQSDDDMTEEESLSQEDIVIVEDNMPLADDSNDANTLLPYHERYYLRYHGGKRCTALDLKGTKSFLRQIGFDGGELAQARNGEKNQDYAGDLSRYEKKQKYCFYCGVEISGVEYFRLAGGRIRCSLCNNTVVETKDEAEGIYRRVVTNMDRYFGASVDVPVSIEFLDERKLKKKIGHVPKGSDDNAIRIFGVAVQKGKEYSIFMESGLPRISVVSTFAHELTHIWQYTHWKQNKGGLSFHKKKRLLIYEGMAKWAEIQYLYLIGETDVAKREESDTRVRNDEYGEGFCIYEGQYPIIREAMTCGDTPFTAEQYPVEP